MGLAGELEAARNYKPDRMRCTVCKYAESLSKNDREALNDALSSDMLTTGILKAIRGWHIKDGTDVPFTLSTLQRHRNGVCRGFAG